MRLQWDVVLISSNEGDGLFNYKWSSVNIVLSSTPETALMGNDDRARDRGANGLITPAQHILILFVLFHIYLYNHSVRMFFNVIPSSYFYMINNLEESKYDLGLEVRAPGHRKSNGALVKFCLRAQWTSQNWRIGHVFQWRDPSNFA